jgi:hypothetical protein
MDNTVPIAKPVAVSACRCSARAAVRYRSQRFNLPSRVTNRTGGFGIAVDDRAVVRSSQSVSSWSTLLEQSLDSDSAALGELRQRLAWAAPAGEWPSVVGEPMVSRLALRP